MLGWSLLHYARCIMAGSGSKSCLFSAVPECLYLTQISCLCVLLLNSGYVRLLGVNLTSHIQLFEHLGAYVRGAFMCRVLNLQPLPIWNLLERPWWWYAASPLLSPLHFLLDIPSMHHPFFCICSCGALCKLLACCFVSLPTKPNIHCTAGSVRLSHETGFLAGAESSGSCEQCLPGDYSIAEGDIGRVHRFWWPEWRASRPQ